MADPLPRPSATPVPAGPPGFVLRPPTSSPTSSPAAAPAVPTGAGPVQAAPGAAPAVPPAPVPTVIVPREPYLVGTLTQGNALLGGGIMVGLAIVFLFLRGAVRNHLISNKAPLSAAGGTGWALFAFLLSVSFTVVFGFLGQFWTMLPVIGPLVALCVVTLILFVVLYNSATRVVRR